jgi:hypothetical protein
MSTFGTNVLAQCGNVRIELAALDGKDGFNNLGKIRLETTSLSSTQETVPGPVSIDALCTDSLLYGVPVVF